MELSGSDLYVGGWFTQTGDGKLTDLGYIVRYDLEKGTWHKLANNGLDYYVTSLQLSGDDLYVGGAFTQNRDGKGTNLDFIARYNTLTETWHPLPNQGFDQPVEEFLLLGSDLYVGGYFDTTTDGLIRDLGGIARCTLSVPIVNMYLPGMYR